MDEKVKSVLLKVYGNEEFKSIKDCSTGYDNDIFIVTLNNDEKIVIRIPRKLNDQDTPLMHRPVMQALILEKYRSLSLPVPSLVYLDRENDRFMVESYLGDYNLSEVFETPMAMTEEAIDSVFVDLANLMKIMHSIRTAGGFGDIVDTEMRGGLASWSDYFDEVKDYVAGCREKAFFRANDQFESVEAMVVHLKATYIENPRVMEYLRGFRDARLVHADLCSNNLRVVRLPNGKVALNGIIDFADSKSGDPLYDMGRILSHVYGNYKFIKAIEHGYGEFTEIEKTMIIYYALSFCLWMLDSSESEKEIVKYNSVLRNLLKIK